MKYIITNCPMYFYNNCYGHTGDCKCQDITDCLLKRIVERCSLYVFNYPVNYPIQMLIQNIKDMLEIEEVDE